MWISMKREKYELILGTGVLALGIAVLFFVLFSAISLAAHPGEFLQDQLPEEEHVEGPRASFLWKADNLTVEFTDTTSLGDANISSWEWDFGDGQTSDEKEPVHIYDSQGDYTAKLTVEDENGKRSTSAGSVYVAQNSKQRGSSTPDFGNFGQLEIDVIRILLPLAITLLVFGIYLVMFLVGAAITKAGWNLIKPKPETVKVRIKPKDIEVEPVPPEMPAPPSETE